MTEAEPGGKQALQLPMPLLATLLVVLVSVFLMRDLPLGRSGWQMIGVLAVGALLLGWLERVSRLLPWLAVLAAGIVLLAWASAGPGLGDCAIMPVSVVLGVPGAAYVVGASRGSGARRDRSHGHGSVGPHSCGSSWSFWSGTWWPG